MIINSYYTKTIKNNHIITNNIVLLLETFSWVPLVFTLLSPPASHVLLSTSRDPQLASYNWLAVASLHCMDLTLEWCWVVKYFAVDIRPAAGRQFSVIFVRHFLRLHVIIFVSWLFSRAREVLLGDRIRQYCVTPRVTLTQSRVIFINHRKHLLELN